ncbi:MAG TPA: hypothetical protein PLX23_09750 [Candidatus Hydrogenedens sp.]|nr:hypothetical protein [Candidatus Hydrogenedens sp.]
MKIGINLLASSEYEPDDLFCRFIYKCLSHAIQLQETTEFFVFFNEGIEYNKWAGWPVITNMKKHERFFSSFSPRGSILDPLIKKFKIEAVITPLETAHFITCVPCIPLIVHIEHWYRGVLKENFFSKRESKMIFQESPLWFTASEYARRSCMEMWKVPLNKIITLLAGVDPILSKPAHTLIAPPYLISVVDDATFYHLPKMLEVMQHFCREQPHTIVLLGKHHSKEPEVWGENIFRVEECPDQTLAGLFQNATAFIYPAIYDGSALRPIEAMQAGTCVITPPGPAIEERCGELPFYYNIESSSSLNAVLHRVINLPQPEREERIRLGRLRVVEHTWEQTTWKLITALKRI